MASTIDQQFVEFVAKSVVSKPDKVKVERNIDEKGVLLELTVDPEDLGRVIGKRGATAQSLRTLLRALGTKNDARYNLKIVDNGDSPAPKADQRDESKSEDDDQAKPDLTESDDNQKSSTEEKNLDSDDETNDSQPSDSVSRTRKELEDLDDLDI